MARQKVQDLRVDSVYSEPISLNWDAPGLDDRARWVVRPDLRGLSNKQIRELATQHLDASPSSREARIRALDEYFEGDGEQLLVPLMRYVYPLPPHCAGSVTQTQLMGTPFCLVDLDDLGIGPALALTCCGLDLTWEICHAYMSLGLLPPFWVCCRVGNSASRKADWRWVCSGIRRTLRVVRDDARHATTRFGEVVQAMAPYNT